MLETLRKYKIHVIIWCLYVIYYLISYLFIHSKDFSVSVFVSILLNTSLYAFVFYSCSLYIYVVYLDKKKYLLTSFFCVVSTSISVGLNFFISNYILIFLGDEQVKMELNWNNFTLGYWNTQIYAFYALGYFFAQKTIQQQKDIAAKDLEIANQKIDIAKKELQLAEERAAKEKAQAEMAFLRSQINPHFMFNTLNMIYSKVRGASREAGDIVIEFADMMRYATSTKLQEDEVDLRGELDFVQQYLSLHKQRNQQNAYIDYDEEGYFHSHRIVPMVLITLVENGIKHGLIDDPNFPLKIRASLIDDVFVFIVHNLKNHHSDQIMDRGNTGIGIKNIIKRLNAVYKNGGFSLDSEDGEDDYIVTFTVDFNLIKK